MKFEELKLCQPLIEALSKVGYVSPTPIQESTILPAINGQDILGCAKTGTGKTAAFALPILNMLFLKDESVKYPRLIKALILAPTRELAIQIDETFKQFNPYVNLKSAAIFGGVRQGSQVTLIQRGIDVLVATPGRLLDLHKQGLLDLTYVEMFVLDEADRMLDMGFINDIWRIVKIIPKQKQTMLFSATLPKEILHLMQKLLNNPIKVMVSDGRLTVENIKQSLYFCDKEDKSKLLLDLLEDPQIYNAIIFVRTKRNAETLCKKLSRAKITCDYIHGDKSQNARNRALNQFKQDKIRILVATDVAARGIDIDDLTHVINYDLPEQAENYVHRIGRTARKGLSGDAISFCSYEELSLLKDIEKFIRQKIPVIQNEKYVMKNKSEHKTKKSYKKINRRKS